MEDKIIIHITGPRDSGKTTIAAAIRDMLVINRFTESDVTLIDEAADLANPDASYLTKIASRGVPVEIHAGDTTGQR